MDSRVTALLFGAPKDDFDFLMDEQDGIAVVYECWPGAFEACYRGKSCSVYEVEETGFQRGLTGWEPELVSQLPVRVIGETVIDDLFGALIQEEKNGRLKLLRYSANPEYTALIEEHIRARMIRFDALRYADTDVRFRKYYWEIVRSLREERDDS